MFFEHLSVQDRRLLGGSHPNYILHSPDGPNSLLAGKNAGNFFDSASFRENPSRKHPRIQCFANKFPKRGAGNYFARAGNSFCGAGNWALAPDVFNRTPKIVSTVDNKIINRAFISMAPDALWLRSEIAGRDISSNQASCSGVSVIDMAPTIARVAPGKTRATLASLPLLRFPQRSRGETRFP
ncbi:MAG TPA: hypothetical protein VGL41_01950 [Roseiarcus sp.]|jgi:hypothetical protein